MDDVEVFVVDWNKIKTVEECVGMMKLLVMATNPMPSHDPNVPTISFNQKVLDKIPELSTLIK